MMVAAADADAWASVRGYFSPATLFLVVNLVIGVIALTSSFTHRRRHRDHHQRDRQAPYQEPLDDPHQHQQEEYDQYNQQPYATPPLARTSSIMDRLRSIGLYRFRSGDFPPEYERDHAAVAPAGVVGETQQTTALFPPVAEVAADDEAAEEELVGGLGSDEPASPRGAERRYTEENDVVVPHPAPTRALSRTSSVLDRIRSLGSYSFFLGAERPAAAATPATDSFAGKKQAATHHYDRSRSEPAREDGKKEKKQAAAEEVRMAKSSSTTRKAVAGRTHPEEDCVDARAEAFIDSFKRGQSSQKKHAHDHDLVPTPAPLPRTSSVLDRLRSFSLYLRSGDDPDVTAPAVDDGAAQYGRSRSEPAREQGKEEKKARVSKSSVPEEEEEECVDARADDFINRFRRQLQLQRLNSLLNYKEVLNRRQ